MQSMRTLYVIFLWSVYSGISTKDLEVVLREMGVIKEEKK